jgi:hypothetical protein
VRRIRVPVGVIIFFFIVIAIVLISRIVPPLQYSNALHVRNAPTYVFASLTIKYLHPPIYQEQYVMRDDNGVSSFKYIVRGTRRQITVSAAPHVAYDVSFFFGKLATDGVWQLSNLPDEGNTSVHYTVFVRQTEAFHTAANSATFTDPMYWATRAGHYYHLHLNPKGPLPNVFTLHGTPLRDRHYLQIVDDFRTFGSGAFHVAISRAKTEAAK